MDLIDSAIKNNLSYIIVILVIINLITLIITLANGLRVGGLKRRYKKLTDDLNDKDLERIILDYYDRVHQVMLKNNDIEQHLKRMEGKLELCAQKIGVVRYNAFDNVGSNLSFAIAVLDSRDNGFVINGVYSRESSTTYAKPIVDGKSKYTLSAEEMQALDLAKKNYSERTFITK
ncbi:MAG: hypothetical protein JG777_1642 [Clostridia bacterium]|jgi:hypothetical protein|uniref:DUF4446 family protein n=1 Tax=Petroclostridium xylanilyticum TaxID=1792311 RepID=UPI000B98B4D8|nr:DUF4446 family protein [Petroclostridium xylanilyticum]MBZ4646153.1 hypothetical protein [Clostridia bacterium]